MIRPILLVTTIFNVYLSIASILKVNFTSPLPYYYPCQRLGGEIPPIVDKCIVKARPCEANESLVSYTSQQGNAAENAEIYGLDVEMSGVLQGFRILGVGVYLKLDNISTSMTSTLRT